MLTSIYGIVLEKLILPIGDWLTGGVTMKTLKEWRRISKLSESEITALSEEKLQETLEYAVRNIPFYSKYIKSKPDEKDPYKWVKSFPIVKKQTIHDHLTQMIKPGSTNLIKTETSGSSGIRGVTYRSKKEMSVTRGQLLCIWEWAGYRIGEKIVQTGMTPNRGRLKKWKDRLFRTHYYVAFGLSDQAAENLLKCFIKTKDTFLIGYASSLYVLAKVAIEHNIKGVRFTKAISLGDKLFPHYRTSIKKAFDCETCDTYGCSEGLILASQKDLEYYYILSPHVYLELLDNDGNEVSDGELGYVVATSLDARSMPLIRYYTGDLAVKLPGNKYPEKRDMNFPLLERIIGRDTDIVRTRSGKYMIVHFFTGIFEFVPEIQQFRVCQTSLDFVEIEFIPSSEFRPIVLKSLEQKIQDYLKEPFEIRWKEVSQIAPSASGKPQIVLSTLPR